MTTLTLEVTGGTRGLKSAKGTLEGHGLGAFTGEGAFSARHLWHDCDRRREEEREVHRNAQRRVEHLLQRRPFLIRQSASGSGGTKNGRMGAVMQHEVGNAACG